jgi:hypothetical protein
MAVNNFEIFQYTWTKKGNRDTDILYNIFHVMCIGVYVWGNRRLI